jgi:hypothetical protein
LADSVDLDIVGRQRGAEQAGDVADVQGVGAGLDGADEQVLLD